MLDADKYLEFKQKKLFDISQTSATGAAKQNTYLLLRLFLYHSTWNLSPSPLDVANTKDLKSAVLFDWIVQNKYISNNQHHLLIHNYKTRRYYNHNDDKNYTLPTLTQHYIIASVERSLILQKHEQIVSVFLIWFRYVLFLCICSWQNDAGFFGTGLFTSIWKKPSWKQYGRRGVITAKIKFKSGFETRLSERPRKLTHTKI